MEPGTIRDLIHSAIHEALQIPEFQREFVRDREQIKLLLDSIYRDYTINSILIWEG